MVYFDSDVLVHYFIAYDAVKHKQSKEIITQALIDGSFYVSQLSMQELTHVMGKFNQPSPLVEESMSILKAVSPVNYGLVQFERALQLAARTGFSGINDCLHTAIAESQNCTELITYNRKQFDIIKTLTSLNVTILTTDESSTL